MMYLKHVLLVLNNILLGFVIHTLLFSRVILLSQTLNINIFFNNDSNILFFVLWRLVSFH